MDGEQGQPAKADRDRDALEQSCEVHRAFGLSEARAGEDEPYREDEAAGGRVGRLSALAPCGEPAAEHEAGRPQRHEGGERVAVVEGAVPAVGGYV